MKGYVDSAEKRGLHFNLSREEFIKITSDNCYYCDIPPSQKLSERPSFNLNGDYVYNGIDRVDNSLGYVTGNCVPCCWTCNRMKLDLTHKEFIEHATKITQKSKSKQ